MTSIAEQVVQIHAGRVGKLPDGVIAVFDADVAGAAAAGVPADVLAVGSPMPDGALVDAKGVSTSLAEVRAGAPAVVVFYRGAWCPYCNVTLRTYQADLVPELQRRGVVLAAISPQGPDGSLSDVEARGLTFAVLSDSGQSVARQLGIATTPADATLEAQRKLGLDLRAVNADGTADLALPTVVVVDAAGMIRFVDVHPDYTTRTEVADILAAVDTL